ncbi:MAG: TIGR01459 family HAD-type hydrolase [Alphaproteobacteria bacterium]|nr:TIGR01459 family HAD-type hydrolase [Alphaproteobacteria bacterium]MBU1512548.1 TIGR01459 family HAD-type hydrolase [Alphaproteobacteria bacterium]MBU2092887.1 TIGR01459 family HAD-type hydrolase [Alphaproteobacteria bacterium]MBU2150874.1 TIGR01459 family HAD-type hydrolase [Alphaproteobacteria bacterium]MBU2307915.1 TIGR01459 family HAD-type hydrolase [Alphaproteobacteria bacterium]
MTSPTPIKGLSELAGRYDVLLCDVWGVIHNGREHFAEACAALARFRAEVGPVILISNAPRPHPPVIEQLDSLGVPRAAWTQLVTSGDATRPLLRARAPGTVWAIGPERAEVLYHDLDMIQGGPEDADFIGVTGPYDDENDEPGDYRDRFIACVARGLDLICANPDIVVQRGDKLIYCGGALAQLYESLGGRTFMAGKPYAPIYEMALERAEAELGRPIDAARVLCVGDGLPTDVRGANARGLDILFVANGIHGAETVGPDGLNLDVISDLLRQEGLQATWAIADMAW